MPSERLRPRHVIGLAILLLGVASASQVHADDPAMDMWQAQRTNFDKFAQNMKPLGKHRISDVLQIRADKKFLVVCTPLSDLGGEESRRATLDGIPGTAIVTVARNDRASGPAEPARFNLAVMDFPGPKQTTTIIVNATLQPNQLMISRTVQTTNGPFQQVIFTQQRGPQSGGTGSVQLMVAESRGQEIAPEQLNFEGADFFSFVREHPNQTERYIRPLLRELGQEAVFAPEQTVAWQVFGELWKPDGTVTRQVQDLLPSLNADDYHVRDAALGRLQQLGRNGAAALMHLERSGLTPEQNARIDRALVPYTQLPLKEVTRLRSDPEFLLDCLYCDDASVRQAAIDRLRAVIRPDLQFDLNAEPAARVTAIAALRQQLLPTRAQPLK